MAGGTNYCCGVSLCVFLFLLSETQAGRCLQYSWLGSEFSKIVEGTEQPNNGTESMRLSNLLCKEFPKPKPIPCVTPFLLTDDATVPDPEKIRRAFDPHDIECDPGDGNICALVTFLFGNEVVNQTAYCTRVTDDGTYMKNGCATAKNGAYTNKVCVCNPSDFFGQFCIPSGAKSIATHKMHILLVCITATLFKVQRDLLNKK